MHDGLYRYSVVSVVYHLMQDAWSQCCLLYTSDAADDLLCVALGGRRTLQKKKKNIFGSPGSARQK